MKTDIARLPDNVDIGDTVHLLTKMSGYIYRQDYSN